jgi:hypothetical protein
VNISEYPNDRTVQFRIFPNPFSESTTLQIDSKIPTYIKADILDIGGNKLLNCIDHLENTGIYNYYFGKNLSKGIYILRIIYNDMAVNIKIIKL